MKGITWHLGGSEAKTGLYLSRRHLSFHSLEDGERLPGDGTEEYLAVPWFALLIAGPLLGLAYVVFLPFLGIATVLWLLASKLVEFVGTAVRASARVLRPGWEPAMAFLGKSKPRGSGQAPADDWADDVRRTLDEETEDDR